MINIIIYFSLLQILLFFILFLKDIIKYKIPLNLIRKRFYDNYIKKDIVLHGVSCGEVKSLRPIIWNYLFIFQINFTCKNIMIYISNNTFFYFIINIKNLTIK